MLTHLIDDAKRKGVRVRINCSHCAAKFLPTHRAAPEGEAQNNAAEAEDMGWDDLAMAMANADKEAKAPQPKAPPKRQKSGGPLSALPNWLRPDNEPDGPATGTTPSQAKATPAAIDPNSDEAVIDAIAAYINADLGASAGAAKQNRPVQTTAPIDAASPDQKSGAGDSENPGAAPSPTTHDAVPEEASPEAREEASADGPPPAPTDAPEKEPTIITELDDAETTATPPAEPAVAARDDAGADLYPPIIPPRPARSLFGRAFGMLWKLALLVVIGLFAAHFFGYPVQEKAEHLVDTYVPPALAEKYNPSGALDAIKALAPMEKIKQFNPFDKIDLENTPGLSNVFKPEPILLADIRVDAASFEVVQDTLGSAVHVNVTFMNKGERTGTIDGFSVVLLDAQGGKLVSWFVSGRAHQLAPKATHEMTSTLFNPPMDIARASIIYPAQ